MQALAKRWTELVEEFTGGDPAIGEALNKMYHNEPSVQQQTGIDTELMAYVSRAMGTVKR